MKRLHISIAVENLTESVRFYTALFQAEPTVLKADYAKWMLDDPRLNFALTGRGRGVGVDHLGFQVDSEAELEALRQQMAGAGQTTVAQKGAVCCYARSDKYWMNDPQGLAWELFQTHGPAPRYGDDTEVIERAAKAACCQPKRSASVSDAAGRTVCCAPG